MGGTVPLWMTESSYEVSRSQSSGRPITGLSLESVFAVLGGWWLLQERMAPHELLGCGLVFAAVILSQLPEKKKN